MSVLELRSGPPTALITLLCVGALLLGGLLAPRRVWAMWKRFAGCRNLYREAGYGELLDMTVGALHERMRLPSKRV